MAVAGCERPGCRKIYLASKMAQHVRNGHGAERASAHPQAQQEGSEADGADGAGAVDAGAGIDGAGEGDPAVALVHVSAISREVLYTLKSMDICPKEMEENFLEALSKYCWEMLEEDTVTEEQIHGLMAFPTLILPIWWPTGRWRAVSARVRNTFPRVPAFVAQKATAFIPNPLPPVVDAEAARVRAAKRAIGKGDVRKGAGILFGGSVHRGSPRVLQNVQDKYELGREEVHDTYDFGHKHGPEVDLEGLTRAVAKLDPRKAQAMSGWSISTLQLAAGSPAFMQVLLRLTRSQCNGGSADVAEPVNLNDPARRWLLTKRGVPLVKGAVEDEIARPVEIGEPLQQAIDSAMAAVGINSRQTLLNEYAFARSGTEIITLTAREALRNGKVVRANDMADAYPTIRHDAIFEALECYAPKMLRASAYQLAAPRDVYYRREDGKWQCMSVPWGVPQGSKFAAWWFALGTRLALERAEAAREGWTEEVNPHLAWIAQQRAHEQDPHGVQQPPANYVSLRVSTFIDDVIIDGDTEEEADDQEGFVMDAYEGTLNVRRNARKRRTAVGGTAHPPIDILGTTIASSVAGEKEAVAAEVAAIERNTSLLLRLPTRDALAILQGCHYTRVGYMARNSLPEASQDAMQGFVRSCVEVLRSMVGEVGEGAWGEVQELRARLPARLGGLQLGDLIGDGHAGPFQAQTIASCREAHRRWEGVWIRQFEMQEVTEAVESGAHILGYDNAASLLSAPAETLVNLQRRLCEPAHAARTVQLIKLVRGEEGPPSRAVVAALGSIASSIVPSVRAWMSYLLGMTDDDVVTAMRRHLLLPLCLTPAPAKASCKCGKALRHWPEVASGEAQARPSRVAEVLHDDEDHEGEQQEGARVRYYDEYHQYACPRGAAVRTWRHTAIKKLAAKGFREYNGGVQTEHQVADGKFADIYVPGGAVQAIEIKVKTLMPAVQRKKGAAKLPLVPQPDARMSDVYAYLKGVYKATIGWQLAAVDKSVQDEYAVAGGVRVWSFDQHGACDVRVDEDLPNDPHASARDRHRLRQRLSVVFVHHASLLRQAYAAAQRGRVAPGGGGGE